MMPSSLIPSSHALAASAAVLAFGLGLGFAGSRPAVAGSATSAPTVSDLIGQRLVVAIKGTRPSPSILERIRRGEIGGVILFGGNIAGPAQLRQLTSSLQAAARAAGRPPLLIATDQEGGAVRRLPWAGPSSGASQLGGSKITVIRQEARTAGLALRAGGVNTDLAPVADVPGRARSWPRKDGRSARLRPSSRRRLAPSRGASSTPGSRRPSSTSPGSAPPDRTPTSSRSGSRSAGRCSIAASSRSKPHSTAVLRSSWSRTPRTPPSTRSLPPGLRGAASSPRRSRVHRCDDHGRARRGSRDAGAPALVSGCPRRTGRR